MNAWLFPAFVQEGRAISRIAGTSPKAMVEKAIGISMKAGTTPKDMAARARARKVVVRRSPSKEEKKRSWPRLLKREKLCHR